MMVNAGQNLELGLKQSKNKIGESVSPWETPLRMGKGAVDQFLVVMEAVSFEYMLLT